MLARNAGCIVRLQRVDHGFAREIDRGSRHSSENPKAGSPRYDVVHFRLLPPLEFFSVLRLRCLCTAPQLLLGLWIVCGYIAVPSFGIGRRSIQRENEYHEGSFYMYLEPQGVAVVKLHMPISAEYRPSSCEVNQGIFRGKK